MKFRPLALAAMLFVALEAITSCATSPLVVEEDDSGATPSDGGGKSETGAPPRDSSSPSNDSAPGRDSAQPPADSATTPDTSTLIDSSRPDTATAPDTAPPTVPMCDTSNPLITLRITAAIASGRFDPCDSSCRGCCFLFTPILPMCVP